MAEQKGLFGRLADAVTNRAPEREPVREGFDAIKSDSSSVIPDWDNSPYARGANNGNQLAKRSVRQLRKWSRTNPWIRSAINLRRGQVSRAKWDIVAVDSDGEPNVLAVNVIKAKLREPNQRGDSFRSFIEPIVEDLLVLDQGCIEVEATVGAHLGMKLDPIANLWAKDGGAIAFDANWDGSDLEKPRYFEYNSEGKLVAQYKTDELVAMIANPVTYSPLGLSPLEVLAETIEADLAAAAYNAKNVMQAAPPGIIDLGEGIRAEQVDAFKSYWEAEISGQAQVAIVGGGKGVKWTPLGASNRDMQFMEWQVYLARKICAVFGVQPQDIGISFDVNKSTAEVGAAFTADNGIAPLLDLIAEYITREIVWRYDKNLRFAYTELGRSSQSAMAEYYKAALSGMPWLRLNDALRERGQDGIGEWGEEVWINTPQGPMPHTLYLQYVQTKVLGAPIDENEPPMPEDDGGNTPPPPPPPSGDKPVPPVPPASGEKPSSPPTPPAGKPSKTPPVPPAPKPGKNPAAGNTLPPTPPAGKAVEVEVAKAGVEPIVICDIDGTLDMGGGKANEAVIEFLDEQALNHRIFIVSGRQKERLAETRKFLDDNEVPHDEVMLNTLPAGPDSEVEFKKQAVEALLKHNIVELAVDNNPAARDAYADAGVRVKDPADLSPNEDPEGGNEDSGDKEGELPPEAPVKGKKSAQLDLTVPQSVRNEAKRGLAWREEYGRGGIGPGQRTARMLSGNAMTIGRVRKMNAYLARHEVDKQGQGWKPGQEGFPSAGRIAWALWGGDAGKRWAGKISRMADAAREA